MGDKKVTPPNMDLIRMVQQARMMHDREAVPSQVNSVYWIEAKPLDETLPPTPRAGEWLIATNISDVDQLWLKIRDATEQGLLGYKSKVATIAIKGQTADERMIVVRTRDADEEDDVRRVEAALRGMGITTMRYEQISES